MNKLNLSIAIISALTFSQAANATGVKGGDPLKTTTTVLQSYTGVKGGDPEGNDRTGVKGGDPVTNDRTGVKGGDPERQVITMDSGYPTLSALLSKYFSF